MLATAASQAPHSLGACHLYWSSQCSGPASQHPSAGPLPHPEPTCSPLPPHFGVRRPAASQCTAVQANIRSGDAGNLQLPNCTNPAAPQECTVRLQAARSTGWLPWSANAVLCMDVLRQKTGHMLLDGRLHAPCPPCVKVKHLWSTPGQHPACIDPPAAPCAHSNGTHAHTPAASLQHPERAPPGVLAATEAAASKPRAAEQTTPRHTAVTPPRTRSIHSVHTRRPAPRPAQPPAGLTGDRSWRAAGCAGGGCCSRPQGVAQRPCRPQLQGLGP